MSHLSHRISPRTSSSGGPCNVYSQPPDQDSLSPRTDIRRRFNSGSVQRPPSILSGLRGLMSRPRSESAGAQMMKKPSKLKKVQVAGCQLTSVYDLREGDEGTADLYDDDWAFRRPRSNSSDFLILRKTSRPLSVDVVGLVDSQSDPYRQYMRVVDCYELAPSSGNIIALDKNMKIDKAFSALCEHGVGAGLVWDATQKKIVSIVTLTDFLLFIQGEEASTSTSDISSLVSGNQLVTVSAEHKIFDACKEFCLNRVHRILVCEPISGDVLYLLTIKRVLQAIHKQNRSLHFAQWLSCPIKESNVGTWRTTLHTVHWSDSVRDAVGKMITHRVSSLPVLNDEEKVIDVIHKADVAIVLRTVTNMQEFLSKTPVSSILSIRPPCPLILPSDSVGKVLDTLLDTQHTRCVFIVDSLGRCLACVSQSDVISHLIYNEPPFHKPKSLILGRTQLVVNN